MRYLLILILLFFCSVPGVASSHPNPLCLSMLETIHPGLLFSDNNPSVRAVVRGEQVLTFTGRAMNQMALLDSFVRHHHSVREVSGFGLTETVSQYETRVVDFLIPDSEKILVLNQFIDSAISQVLDAIARNKSLELASKNSELHLVGDGLFDATLGRPSWEETLKVLEKLTPLPIPRDYAAAVRFVNQNRSIHLNTEWDLIAAENRVFHSTRFLDNIKSEANRRGISMGYWMHYHPHVISPNDMLRKNIPISQYYFMAQLVPSTIDLRLAARQNLPWIEIRLTGTTEVVDAPGKSTSIVYSKSQIDALAGMTWAVVSKIESVPERDFRFERVEQLVQKIPRLLDQASNLNVRFETIVEYSLGPKTFDRLFKSYITEGRTPSLKWYVMRALLGKSIELRRALSSETLLALERSKSFELDRQLIAESDTWPSEVVDDLDRQFHSLFLSVDPSIIRSRAREIWTQIARLKQQ